MWKCKKRGKEIRASYQVIIQSPGWTDYKILKDGSVNFNHYESLYSDFSQKDEIIINKFESYECCGCHDKSEKLSDIAIWKN